ncbi:MAG: response regulator [Lachnospiraceae bacterium]|nr:response regulator [Lachnospiraceae bacterium]
MAKIIIVDDSRILRKILNTTLTDAGHEIVGEAGNGEEVLKLLETVKTDLITLDITMPVMDGLQALRSIKEKYPGIKVVMVSAAGQKNKVMEALKGGASDFLQKPFEPEDVKRVVSKLV